jgi:hypothetical protein
MAGLTDISVSNLQTPHRSLYHELNNQQLEIRILTITEASTSEDIKCELKSYSCRNGYPEYTALSYCWGHPGNDALITVNNQPFHVRRNLFEALQELRERHICDLWTDAICVNQSDTQERGHQVARMEDIYRNATATISWLGCADAEYAEIAFALMNVMATREPEDEHTSLKVDLKEHSKTLQSIPKWNSLKKFMGLPYWHRTWITQELALSPQDRVTFVWGKHSLSLEVLKSAIPFIHEHKGHRTFYTGYYTIGGVLNVIKGITKKSPTKLLNVLSYSCLSQSTEPLDKIFGVLGMCVDGLQLIPSPDYVTPMDTVLENLMVQWLKSGTSIDILCLDNAKRPRRTELPSWVIDWTAIWSSSIGDVISSTTARDFKSGFRACGRSSSVVSFPQPHILVTQGYVFDTIQNLNHAINHPITENLSRNEPANEPSPEKTVNYSSLIYENIYGTERDLYDAIWRTLTYDRYGYSNDPPQAPAVFERYFREIFDEKAQSLLRGGDPNEEKYIFHHLRDFPIYGRTVYDWSRFYLSSSIRGSTLESSEREFNDLALSTDPSLQSYLRAIRVTQFWRRMMVTSRGFVGAAHRQSQTGDSIVLLKGATLPMVLRKCEGGWRIVGEAYVQGIMNGEFWNKQKEGDFEEFYLK